MHKATFFPIGNGDCCLIDLACGEKLLFDYANLRSANDSEDPRINLADAIREDLKKAGRQDFNVVAFTHLDDDHIHGASELFYLRHAKKYQDDDRIKINELWVPAAAIVEKGCTDEARIIQAEAQHRLREGKGIRVFSRPNRLKEWLEKEGIKLEDREDLITDAGKLIPGFTKSIHGIEFFVHSPFAVHLGDELVDRNECSLVFQATFDCDGQETRSILSADTIHEILTDIVSVTKYHKNEARLVWDIFKLPHHCSYLSLNSERGTNVTDPVSEVRWLFEQGAQGGVIVSTSKPIPSNDSDNQPPHRQAANYYKKRATAIDGEFVVTMEYPTVASPEPLIIIIDKAGARVKKTFARSSLVVTSRPAPRAG